MHDIPSGTLQDELDAFLAFAPGGVVLWHDPDGTYAGALDALALPADVQLVREASVPSFWLLQSVNGIAPDETLLLYRNRRHRIEEADWLADIEAYAACFAPSSSAQLAPAASEARPVAHLGEGGAQPAPSPEGNDAQPIPSSNETAAQPLPAPREAAAQPLPDLTDNWYSLTSFRTMLAATGVTEANLAAAAKQLGYRLFDDCALRHPWESPTAYYRSLFENELVPHSNLSEAMRAAGSFKTYLAGALAKSAVLDYDDETWITGAGLRELDIAATDLDAFAWEAVKASVDAGIPQFTVPWLRANAPGLSLLAYDFADCFYESVLLARRHLATRGHLGGRRIFAEPHTQARGRDLVESLVRAERSLDVEELLDILQHSYGVPIQRAPLITLMRATNLFFSPELDRVYEDHDQFVREVE